MARVAGRAPGRQPLAVHVQHAPRAGAFVQVVDVLGDDQQTARRHSRSSRASASCAALGCAALMFARALVVEPLDQVAVAPEGLGRGDVLDAVILPQPVGRAEGVASPISALIPGASEDDDVAEGGHVPHEARVKREAQWHGSASSAAKGAWATRWCAPSRRPAHEVAGGIDKGGDVASLADASDVLLDFSAPFALDANLHAAIGAGVPILVGTTGLDEANHVAIDCAARAIPVLQTGNTSLGVTLLAHLVREAASRLGRRLGHRGGRDAPPHESRRTERHRAAAGQAAADGRGIDLAENSERGRDGVTGARQRGAIGFASLRGGTVAGDHTVHLRGRATSA